MKTKLFVLLAILSLAIVSCDSEKKEKPSYSSPKKEEVKKVATEKVDINAPSMDNKGIGPIKSITLEAIDEALVERGKEVYKINCSACHKFKKRYIGPALGGITERRSPEWIMNMILNPDEMLKKDPIGKALIKEYNAPMANQQLSVEDVRAILEYFRTKK